VAQALQRFIEVTDRIEQATVDDIVRVRVGPAMIVRSVEILDRTLDSHIRQRLETAILGAVRAVSERIESREGFPNRL
jgi:hypothetical protein